MGLEYRAEADFCRFVSQNLPNERNIEVISFNSKLMWSIKRDLRQKGKEVAEDFAIVLFILIQLPVLFKTSNTE